MKERRIGRRDFVKTTLAGAGGLFLLSSEAKGQEKRAVDSKGKERTFLYRTLGRTGLKLPVINMGVMNSDNPNLIRAAAENGKRRFAERSEFSHALAEVEAEVEAAGAGGHDGGRGQGGEGSECESESHGGFSVVGGRSRRLAPASRAKVPRAGGLR